MLTARRYSLRVPMTTRLLKRVVWVAALAALGCGPVSGVDAAREAAGARVDGIVGGTPTTGDPAVVVLLVGGERYREEFCTGTLIAPKTVLTAAHCIKPYGDNQQYWVGFGATVRSTTQVVRVTRQEAHPQYRGSTMDFGLLQLERAVVNVAPIALNERALTNDDVGRSVRHVGFGVTDASGAGSGTKREVTYNVREVRPYTMESGATGRQTCSGDSGGPAFMVMADGEPEKVAGVVSYGDQYCTLEGWDGRVDAALTWLRPTMALWEAPTCEVDAACVPGCTPVDQDCACAADGQCTADCLDPAMDPDCPSDCGRNQVCATEACPTPDPDCVAVGVLCDGPQQCQARLCVTDAQHAQPYCSQPCGDADACPPTMECSDGQCRFPQRPERQLGETCTAADFCAGGICAGPAGGLTRCVVSCSSRADCPQGSTCEASATSQRYCRPPGVDFSGVVATLAADDALGPAAPGCNAIGGGPQWLWLAALAALHRRRSRR